MRRFFAISLTVTALLVGTLSYSNPAWAGDYPSWGDVQAAKANEAAKQAEIKKIQGFISSLALELQAATAEADARGACLLYTSPSPRDCS